LALVTKEYLCESCGDIEFLQNHTEIYEKCPICNGDLERLISGPIISKLCDPRTVGSLLELNNRRNPLSRERAFGVGAEEKLNAQSRTQKIQAINTNKQMRDFIEKGIL